MRPDHAQRQGAVRAGHRVLGTRSWFYTAMGGVALLAVAVGFGRTYALPMSRGQFNVPVWLHVHGALALTWVMLFLVQPLLVRVRAARWHRRIGMAGLPLAMAIAVSMIPAGLVQVARERQAGGGASSLLGVVTGGFIFAALVTAGIAARRDREAHARWMLLATLQLVWPAWFRFRHWFPNVPSPEVWFAFVLAYVWIGVAALRDHRVRGAVHPVLAWGGTLLVLEQGFEVLAFDSTWWRATAQALYGWLGP